jgi:hypothetical protein
LTKNRAIVKRDITIKERKELLLRSRKVMKTTSSKPNESGLRINMAVFQLVTSISAKARNCKIGDLVFLRTSSDTINAAARMHISVKILCNKRRLELNRLARGDIKRENRKP